WTREGARTHGEAPGGEATSRAWNPTDGSVSDGASCGGAVPARAAGSRRRAGREGGRGLGGGCHEPQSDRGRPDAAQRRAVRRTDPSRRRVKRASARPGRVVDG